MIVLFRSVTSSLRVKKILGTQGIKAESVQTTKSPGIPSCGHALKLDAKYLDNVKSAAEMIDVQIKGVYDE